MIHDGGECTIEATHYVQLYERPSSLLCVGVSACVCVCVFSEHLISICIFGYNNVNLNYTEL